ncbi:MAG: hypothetical protein J2O49_08965 [Sciscionella sp.]|nr:hypothetical protein [Sciscionella sp.]
MRSKVQQITPDKAQRWLDEANTHNRPLSAGQVRLFADAMLRGDWKVTHQGIGFDADGTLIDGQHRLAAVVEAGIPVEMTVITDAPTDTFDVLDTGRRRGAADALAIEGEHNPRLLAAMVRIVYQYETKPDGSWNRGNIITNHQIMQALNEHPKLREFISVADDISSAISMIKSAAGAAAYLTARDVKPAKLQPWYDGLINGTGLTKSDPRLLLRNTMFRLGRKEAGQLQRRDPRQHLALYLMAFNAWAGDEPVTRLRYDPRQPLPAVRKP